MDMPVIVLLTLLPGLCVANLTGNLALGQNAVQSSTFEDHATAGKATDGNKESVYKKFSCTHTTYEQNPWWSVDLKHVYKVTKVTITNHGDCCEERINDAQIRVGNNRISNGNINQNQLAEVILSMPLEATETYTFRPIGGQYVDIVLPWQGILTLCEVEVFAKKEDKGSKRNLALGTTLSSHPHMKTMQQPKRLQMVTKNQSTRSSHALTPNMSKIPGGEWT
ncbi:fucolectin-like [Myxocyprinus asiaticus]|uniref:fucolectin-like n=1 Tax=Myxocyprinus asiaticus TaxID=70543 RepID=UPI0022217637|nr:fucolectin-like [Myxocyprinus asiaticus]